MNDLLKLIQDELKASEPIRGILGRSTDNATDASAETNEKGTYYVQVEDAPDPRIAYIDPSVLNTFAVDVNAPVKLKYEDGKLVIQGVQAGQISSYYSTQQPSVYFYLTTDSGTADAVNNAATLSVLGGTGMNVTNSATTATVTLETPVVVANGGTGRSTLTANNLLAGNTTGTVNLIAPGSNGNVLFVSAGAFTSGTLNLDTANLSGTLALAQGGANTSLAATGGTSFVLMQESLGADITVRQLTAADISTSGTLFTLAGSSGSSQAISRGDTLTIAAVAPITATAGATDTVTIAIPDFGGASSGADGSRGSVPQPLTGQQNRILTADGTWKSTMDSVAIGGTTPTTATFTTANVSTTLNISPTSTSSRSVLSNGTPNVDLFGTGGGSIRFSFGKTDLSSPGAAESGDQLGYLQFRGWGTSGYVTGAYLIAEAIETFTNSTSATKFKFQVTPTGSTTPATALTINSDKSVTFAGDIDHDSTKIGFFGVTPDTRPTTTEDIKDGLTRLGLLQGTSATPLNLDGGTLTAGMGVFSKGTVATMAAANAAVQASATYTGTASEITEMMDFTFNDGRTTANSSNQALRFTYHRLSSATQGNGAYDASLVVACQFDADLSTGYYADIVSEAANIASGKTLSNFRHINIVGGNYGTGTITNHYGLYVEGMTGGTNNYAIYTNAGDIRLGGSKIGFFAGTPATKPTVTGSRGGNAALASLLTGLAGLGLLTDSSSA